MKRNENFVLKELMGSFVLVPVGEAAMNLNGVISLNESAKFLWYAAEGEFELDDLVDALVREYKIDIQDKELKTQYDNYIENALSEAAGNDKASE